MINNVPVSHSLCKFFTLQNQQAIRPDCESSFTENHFFIKGLSLFREILLGTLKPHWLQTQHILKCFLKQEPTLALT